MQETHTRYEDATNKLKRVEANLAAQEPHRVALENTLLFRRKEKELVEHSVEMSQIKAKIDDRRINSDISGRIQDMEDERMLLHNELMEIKGAVTLEQGRLDKLINELNSPRYKHIDQRFKTKMIEVKTALMVNQDLETYSKALDKALMQFHKMRMRDINEVLKEYWRDVYKGNDIDEIFIKSEDTTSTKGGRRSYNYRVCMRYQDKELNMRGRCSAGQKVLASLLIRMALAETFCVKCGIMALDEPTTNLDTANIKALARALTAIIRKRQKQSNFQLLVITHDEEFVSAIETRGCADYYYRLSKDPIEQTSRITKYSMASVMS